MSRFDLSLQVTDGEVPEFRTLGEGGNQLIARTNGMKIHSRG